MRKLREILRLHHEVGLTHRAIAGACTLGLGTVSTYLSKATAAGLTWPLPEDLDDAALEARLFTRPVAAPGRDRTLPDWPALHQELKRPGVTLMLLWQEYRAAHPSGYAYSQFCERYRQWARRLKPTQAAQRWVLAVLRHRTFFTLADLNAAIRERIEQPARGPLLRGGLC